MKSYKTYQVALIVAFSVLINIGGRLLSDALELPIWLDSAGTFLTACLLGPACGAMVGVSGNVLHGLFFPPSFAYSITSVCIALTVGFLASRGWMDTFMKTMSLSVLITIECVVTASTLNIFVFDGKINNIWGEGIAALFQTFGMGFPFNALFGQFYVDFLDKIITLGFVFYLIRAFRAIKSRILSFSKAISAVLVLPFFCSPAIFAQESFHRDFNSFVRTVYNSENGIPCGEANAIASTNDGVMWIGTYAGLYRHSGGNFRLMSDFKSIKAVKCLYVDDEGRLFVGTNDNGLSIIINETVANTLEEKDGLPADSVRCIARASNGYYYIGTAKEMAVISITDGLGIKGTIKEIKDAVRVAADDSDRIFALTSAGDIFIVQGAGDSPVLSNRIIWDSKSDGIKYTAIAFGKDGLLYAATSKNELLMMELSGNPKNTVEKVHSIDCTALEHINSIEFIEGTAFLSADNGAAYIEDGVLHTIATGDFNNSIEHITEDYQGNLWFSSSRLGLLKMCESAFAEVFESAGFEGCVINSTLRFNGDMYFATDDGLCVADGKTGLKSENELTKMLKNTRVRCLMEDKNGVMWICTKQKGLLSFDGENIASLGEGHSFRSAITLDDGTILAGGNDGVMFIRDGKIISSLGIEDGFENPVVLCVCQTKDGNILAGTDGGGLALIEKRGEDFWQIEKNLKRSDGLSSNVILRAVNDKFSESGVFVITSNGLCYMEKKSVPEQSKAIYEAHLLENFPYYNNFDAVISDSGDIFVLGSAGIFIVSRNELLSGNKVDFELLDIKKGLISPLTANSWNYIDSEQNLYLSCGSGSCRINLSSFEKSERSFRIQLKSVLVDSKRHVVQKDIPFLIPATSETVEIQPEIINYSLTNPYVSIFLEGVDEKPVVTLQSEVSSTIYSNLKAGTYRFHIAVLDSKGRRVTEESVYEITKAFHFYDNWWFLLYALGVFMLAVAWLSWYATSTLLRRRMAKQENEMAIIKNQVRMGNETIFAIANAVEARDKSTGRHSFRVSEYSVMIAKELGFSEEETEALRKTGLLHDIGKIGVPDSILNKLARLTDEEYAIMQTHVSIGGEILKDFTLIENVSDGAKYHHERYDGKGYPNKLKGEKIPLNARIIGIADAFDAMTANRVYRKALDMDYVLSELRRCRGTQFDPSLTDIMIELIESGRLNPAEIYKKSERKNDE